MVKIYIAGVRTTSLAESMAKIEQAGHSITHKWRPGNFDSSDSETTNIVNGVIDADILLVVVLKDTQHDVGFEVGVAAGINMLTHRVNPDGASPIQIWMVAPDDDEPPDAHVAHRNFSSIEAALAALPVASAAAPPQPKRP